MKILRKMMSCLLAISIILPSFTVFANELDLTDVTIDNFEIVESTDDFTIKRNSEKIIFHDHNNNEITEAYFNSSNSLTIYEPDGGIIEAVRDSDGNIFMDGKLVIECIKESDINSKEPEISLYSVPSGYKVLTTHYTSTDIYTNTASLSLVLVGLLPGFTGVASVIGAINAIKGLLEGSETVYLKIVQYYHPTTYYIYDVIYYYKYSNYTGLLKTTEHGPRKPI